MGSTPLPMNSNPLLSALVSFCVLYLLYAPRLLLRLLISPVLISTGVLLVGILRLGSIKKQEQLETPKKVVPFEDEEYRKAKESKREAVYRREQRFSDVLVERHWRTPLEVIYEDYEGEVEEEKGEVAEGGLQEYSSPVRGWEETCSLHCYYPDSNSHSLSDGGRPAMWELERPENWCFRWEDDKNDGLIEIPIFQAKNTCQTMDEGFGSFSVEDDNLIEIDLFNQTVIKRPSFPAKI